MPELGELMVTLVPLMVTADVMSVKLPVVLNSTLIDANAVLTNATSNNKEGTHLFCGMTTSP
ncbi:MAG: hypothetical protein IT434_08275 [Phycisphaerales bacterium]|nr:hypothetical protein [Phycisphaerales bacterium]